MLYTAGNLLIDVLGEYVSSLRQNPDDPMLNLLVGMTFVHLASQKFALKRHALVTQVMYLM
jgi:general transcription factor 3C polypeptide 3 (transcription factor C subunit 4)